MPKRPIIAFATSKGGSGKTTGLIILASVFANEGGRVAIIDTDPTETLSRWAARPETPEGITAYKANNPEELMDAIDDAELSNHLILVDIEGRASDLGNAAIARSTLVVIPVRPSEPDGVEASKTIRAIRAVERSIEREKRFCVIINALPGAIRSRTYYDVLSTFKENNIPIAAYLVDREIYRRMLMDGGSIYSLSGVTPKQQSAAQDEAFTFADNIAELVGLSRNGKGTARPSDEAADRILEVVKSASSVLSVGNDQGGPTLNDEASRVVEQRTKAGEGV